MVLRNNIKLPTSLCWQYHGSGSGSGTGVTFKFVKSTSGSLPSMESWMGTWSPTLDCLSCNF
jgi:hypothetical protein